LNRGSSTAGDSGQHRERHQDPALHLDGKAWVCSSCIRAGSKADRRCKTCATRFPARAQEFAQGSGATIVERLDINAAPVMSLALAGSFAQARISHRWPRTTIKQRLQAINGVGGVDIIGGQEREFHVWIRSAPPESYGPGGGRCGADVGCAERGDPRAAAWTWARSELSVKTRARCTRARVGGHHHHRGGWRAGAHRDVPRWKTARKERRSYSTLTALRPSPCWWRSQSGSNTVEVAPG